MRSCVLWNANFSASWILSSLNARAPHMKETEKRTLANPISLKTSSRTSAMEFDARIAAREPPCPSKMPNRSSFELRRHSQPSQQRPQLMRKQQNARLDCASTTRTVPYCSRNAPLTTIASSIVSRLPVLLCEWESALEMRRARTVTLGVCDADDKTLAFIDDNFIVRRITLVVVRLVGRRRYGEVACVTFQQTLRAVRTCDNEINKTKIDSANKEAQQTTQTNRTTMIPLLYRLSLFRHRSHRRME